MMKKTIKVLSIVYVVLISLVALAQLPGPQMLTPKGDAVVFKLTFTKFELQDDAGTWHVVNNTPTTVNILDGGGSGGLAKAIGGNAVSLPVGHYKAFRSTVSGTMTLKGYAVIGGTVYYTTTTTTPVSARPGFSPDGEGIDVGTYVGTEVEFLNNPPADYKEGTIRPPEVETTFVGAEEPEDITITAGGDTPFAEDMVVNVTGTIQVWDLNGDNIGDVIMPGTPQISVP